MVSTTSSVVVSCSLSHLSLLPPQSWMFPASSAWTTLPYDTLMDSSVVLPLFFLHGGAQMLRLLAVSKCHLIFLLFLFILSLLFDPS